MEQYWHVSRAGATGAAGIVLGAQRGRDCGGLRRETLRATCPAAPRHENMEYFYGYFLLRGVAAIRHGVLTPVIFETVCLVAGGDARPALRAVRSMLCSTGSDACALCTAHGPLM
eukprot:jgi/Ulvmu1/9484/UM052_0054.1